MSNFLWPFGLQPTRLLCLSVGFSRQEHWSGLPCLSAGNLTDPGIEPSWPRDWTSVSHVSLHRQAVSLPLMPCGKPADVQSNLLTELMGVQRAGDSLDSSYRLAFWDANQVNVAEAGSEKQALSIIMPLWWIWRPTMILWQIWICFFVVCHWYGVSHDTEHCVMLGWMKNTEAIACGIMRNLTLNLTLALSNSMKLWAMLCTATQDRWVMVESPEKMWSTGEGNGKPLQYSCLENPMNSMKRQEDRTLKDELPRSAGSQYATGEE